MEQFEAVSLEELDRDTLALTHAWISRIPGMDARIPISAATNVIAAVIGYVPELAPAAAEMLRRLADHIEQTPTMQ